MAKHYHQAVIFLNYLQLITDDHKLSLQFLIRLCWLYKKSP